MYSLLVSHLVGDTPTTALEMERSRFLEYTSEAISSQLEGLSVEAIDVVKSWPCVLMQEGRGQEVVHIAQVVDLQTSARNIKLVVTPIASTRAIVNDALWKLRAELDIAEFEFNRNHWAFKDRDLFVALSRAGYFCSHDISRFENKALPAPTRRELLGARNVIAEWSHTALDDLLLEAGVADLNASRAIGSRRDRANAIVEFALANPTVNTVENSMFSTFIVRAALKHPDSPATLDSPALERPIAESVI